MFNEFKNKMDLFATNYETIQIEKKLKIASSFYFNVTTVLNFSLGCEFKEDKFQR